jgi:flagellar hook-length control protein FliK
MRLPSTPVSAQTATETATARPPQAASTPNGLTKPPTETAAPRPPQTASAPDGMAKSPLETMRPPSTPVTTHLTAGIRSAVLLAPTTTSPLAAPLVMTAAMEAVAKPAKDRAPTSGKTAPLGAAAESARQPLQELSRHVEGALARMQYHQLASLPPEDANRQVWQLELPVKIEQHIESVKLRIEKDQHHGEDGEQQASWRVNLAFDLEPLGPLQVRIGLQGDTVSSVFWARREHTAALIAARLEELRQGLRRVGLNVGELAARQGRLPEPDVAVAADQAVLDERA